jgi:hypothetical protein
MVTGWFDFTLVCVLQRLMQTVDIFFIGRDWKKFRSDIATSLFPLSPKPIRTNAVSDDLEKSLVRKNAGNCARISLVSFWYVRQGADYPFLRAGRQEDLMLGTRGTAPARRVKKIFGKNGLKKMK